ncbi:MAG: tetratricopeptide repeat protein [Proteobacteria bacterium]|nr:tetratricopeptide repeat protein [Pseudomonadota bacterium]
MTPAEVQGLKQAARTALESGQNELAERAARRLVFEAPSAEAYDILSCALRNQERFSQALSASDAALRLDPNDVPARHNRALVLTRLGRSQEALKVFDALISAGVRAPPLWLGRGSALMELSRVADAEAAFADGVRQWPNDGDLLQAFASVRWMRRAKPDFAGAFEAAVARNPEIIPLRLGCADLLRRAGFADKCESMLRKGLARAPDTPVLLSSLATVLDESGRCEEALALYERAVAIAPGIAVQRAGLANVYLRLGRAAEALGLILPLRAAQPLNQEWITYETTALRQLGDARYHDLCDYDFMVRAYDIATPPGYTSVEAFNEEFYAALMRLHVLDAHPLDQSLHNGSQTTRNLTHVADPPVQAYFKAIDAPIQAYMELMREHARTHPNHPWSSRVTGKYSIAGSWSVRLKADGFHVNHFHPAGWISSAYYVSLPKAVTEAPGQQGWIKFGEPRWPTPGCTIEKVVQPQAGRLVLFPSYMWHGTIPFSEGERMTAPIDVVPA